MQEESYSRIPLYGREGIKGWATIDTADEPRVLPYRWHMTSHGYVARAGRKPEKQSIVYLHRWLLNVPPGRQAQVDHINRDKLDNRRCNLRVVSPAENRQNVVRTTATSRFRGVFWDNTQNGWVARIQIDGKVRQLGVFAREVDAAVAVEACRSEHQTHAGSDPYLRVAILEAQLEVAESFIPNEVWPVYQEAINA